MTHNADIQIFRWETVFIITTVTGRTDRYDLLNKTC
jgi:hypothetical protein